MQWILQQGLSVALWPFLANFVPENIVCISTLKGLNNNIFKALLDVIVYTLI